MNIECDACKTVFKIKDGIILPGSKIKFTCKKCKPLSIAPDGIQSAENGDPPTPSHDRAANVPSADHPAVSLAGDNHG